MFSFGIALICLKLLSALLRKIGFSFVEDIVLFLMRNGDFGSINRCLGTVCLREMHIFCEKFSIWVVNTKIILTFAPLNRSKEWESRSPDGGIGRRAGLKHQ